jgi:hypothetical protein
VIFYDDCAFAKSAGLDCAVLHFVDTVKSSGWTGTFQLEMRCDAVADLSDESLSLLAAGGCRQINMGIEKGEAAQLKKLNKHLSPEVARDAVEKVIAVGIRAAGTFILGGPGEVPADLQATIDFAVSLPLTFAHFGPLAVHPGTTLYDEVFGLGGPGTWLQLCLNPEYAPAGDILWRSEELPLLATQLAMDQAYRRFYTSDRLTRVLAAAPEHERSGIATAYELLAKGRSQSYF